MMYLTGEVDSTCLATFTYDETDETMGITFRNGSTHYYRVDFYTFLDFLKADSKGSFYNHYIKGICKF